ncbi:cytosolic carboxypeptidase 2-like [Centroberyx affinis]|uniref:cytosolic carboxypeptidase 2-like n=1 Tax=Centroberyx affinis TaxID=166261 RepID=UPI003A5BACCF
MTGWLVEQGKKSLRERLWRFDLESFDKSVQPLLTLMWEVNISMKMMVIEFLARIVLNSPEANSPCFQDPQIIRLADKAIRSLMEKQQQRPGSSLLGPREVVMLVVPKVLQGFWINPATLLSVPPLQLSDLAAAFSCSIRDEMVLLIQNKVREKYTPDVLLEKLKCFGPELLTRIVDITVGEIYVMFEPQKQVLTTKEVELDVSTQPAVVDGAVNSTPLDGDLSKEPGLEEDTTPSPEMDSAVGRENTHHGSLSAIRNWRNVYPVDHPDTNDSNTEEEEQDLAGKRQFSTDLSQALRTRQLVIDFNGSRPIFSLREPLDLFTFPSVSCPRWPIECEVIDDIIHHIEWDPPDPEPFYQPTGHERAPMPVGEERGNVVYCVDHATKRPYFTCSRVGGSRGPIKSAAPFGIPQRDPTLDFESRFESGNLQKAVQVGVHDYELTLRSDMYTNKHTQWFYFRVRNMKAGVTYRFTIINLMKGRSLYSLGMRPLLYSERACEEKGVGWHRIGSNIRYYRNCNQDNNSLTVTLYSLTWTCQFPYDSDTCYLAHCYPYTYSHLQRYLSRVTSDPAVAAYCKLRVLCRSLAGNNVYVLTVSSPGGGRAEGRTRKAVVVTARVHPGETNGSWMMEGFLDFLLGDSDDAQLLRDTFVFKVVPMLNPDGVVVGNYRCSLAGRDLNRNYRTMLRDSFPCVWHTRNMVKRLMAERDVVLYCDFHGHSRKNNVFMYGCNNRDDTAPQLHERVFPLMMSKNANDKFSFRSCKFRVQKSKEGTGRIVMWRLGIRNSYTMESTFGGSTLGNRRGTHFTTRDLKSLGYYFCDTLLDYCDPDPTKTAYCLTELAALLRQEVRQRLGKELDTDCNISVSDLETSTSGSNSTDSDGLPAHLLNQPDAVHPQQTPVKKKKKHLRSRKDRNRLRQDRGKNSSEPKVLHSSIKNIEPDLPRENTVKVKIRERTVVRDKRREQVNSLVRKPVIPCPATHLSGIGHVTLWQGGEPVKNECLEAMRAAYLHRRAKAYPQLSTYATVSPHSEEPEETGQRKCSTQLLHLSALLPPQPHVMEPPQQQQPLQPFVSHKGFRGRLPASLTATHRSPSGIYFKVVPEIVPTKCLISSVYPGQFDAQQLCVDRNALRVSARYFVPEDSSSTSHTDALKSKQRHQEQEGDAMEVGVSLLRGLPLSEQDHRDLTPDHPLRKTEPDANSFLRGLRGMDPRGKSLLNGQAGIALQRMGQKRVKQREPAFRQELGEDAVTAGSASYKQRVTKETKELAILPPLSRLTLAKDTTHSHPGRESQRSMAPEERMVKRPSQSAPL